MAFGVFALIGIAVPILVSCTIAQEPQDGPSFLVRPTLAQSDIGGTVELSCAITNLGSRRVEWHKLGSETVAEGTEISNPDNGHRMSAQLDTDLEDQTTFYYLTITGLTDEDAGYYHCVVVDEEGFVDSPYYVRILVGDIIDQVSVGLSATNYAELNGLIILTCLNPTGGTHLPDWFKDGNHLTSSYDPHVNMQEWEAQENRGAASAIIIQNARMSDAGTYVCRGSGSEDNLFLNSARVMVLRPGRF